MIPFKFDKRFCWVLPNLSLRWVFFSRPPEDLWFWFGLSSHLSWVRCAACCRRTSKPLGVEIAAARRAGPTSCPGKSGKREKRTCIINFTPSLQRCLTLKLVISLLWRGKLMDILVTDVTLAYLGEISGPNARILLSA